MQARAVSESGEVLCLRIAVQVYRMRSESATKPTIFRSLMYEVQYERHSETSPIRYAGRVLKSVWNEEVHNSLTELGTRVLGRI
jgi:hypothetical protein